jgi:hypothetical protein
LSSGILKLATGFVALLKCKPKATLVSSYIAYIITPCDRWRGLLHAQYTFICHERLNMPQHNKNLSLL